MFFKKFKFPFDDKSDFIVNESYEAIDKITEIKIDFDVNPQVIYEPGIDKHALILNVSAVYLNEYTDEPIISYKAKAVTILDLTNRENDKDELIVWLKHINACVRGYWESFCPIPYMLYNISLDISKSSDKILDFLEAENLYL